MEYKGKLQKSISKVIFYGVLLTVSLTIIIPMFLILLTSFKSEAESTSVNFSFPKTFRFSNYLDVIVNGKILNSMLNGILITVSAVTLVVLFSSIAAFYIQRSRNKKGDLFYKIFLMGLVAPLSVIPEIFILKSIHLINTYGGIILVHVSANIAFGVILYTGFIKGIPRELDESALLDGCSPYRLFFQIIFPLLKPVVFTNIVIAFMGVWNDFQYTIYFLSSSNKWTMPITVYNFFGFHTAAYNLVCADIILTVLPILLVFLFAQKYIISGMTAGAVKG